MRNDLGAVRDLQEIAVAEVRVGDVVQYRSARSGSYRMGSVVTLAKLVTCRRKMTVRAQGAARAEAGTVDKILRAWRDAYVEKDGR